MSSAAPGTHVPLLERPAGAAAVGPGHLFGSAPGQHALRTLREVVRAGRAVVASGSGQAVIERAAATACAVLGYAAAAVAVRDPDGSFRYCAFFSAAVPGPEHALAGRSLPAAAYQSMCHAAQPVEGALWLAPGHSVLALASVAGGLPSWDGETQHRNPAEGLLWAPMAGEDGRHTGFIEVRSSSSGAPPGPAEALLLATLSEVTALGLDVQKANDAERRSASVALAERRQLENLIYAGLEVRGESGLDEVLSDIAAAMVPAAGFARAAIYLVDPRAPTVAAAPGFRVDEDSLLAQVPITLVATVGLRGRQVSDLSTNFRTLDRFAPLMRPEMLVSRSYLFDHCRFQLPAAVRDDLVPGQEAPGWTEGMWHADDSLTVPLADREGRMLGLISMDEPLNRCLPTVDDCRALEIFADQCALAVVEARRLEQAWQEAATDALTGLPNRRAFLDRAPALVQASRNRGTGCAALYIDIDRFKDINDSFGHATGDQVIAAVGHAIAARLRRGDLLARYGGEEFVAILPGTSLEEAARLAEEIRTLVPSAPLPEVHPPLEVHVCVGVAGLRAGDDTAALLAAADAALYRAKHSGRDRVCLAPA
jgi:diguanylate cyclase (GGDEF)-like protein